MRRQSKREVEPPLTSNSRTAYVEKSSNAWRKTQQTELATELTRRLKEEMFRKCSFVSGDLFQGATTRSEKKYLTDCRTLGLSDTIRNDILKYNDSFERHLL
jgi:hypothetical protein